MEDLHRELLKKRQRYLQENVIMEEGLLTSLQEKGVFTPSMVAFILVSLHFYFLGSFFLRGFGKSGSISAISNEGGGFFWVFFLRLLVCITAHSITKTRLYSFDPLKPHFYTVKLGFTGVYINFLISAQKHRLWVLVRTASLAEAILTSTHNLCFEQKYENYQNFSSESFHCLYIWIGVFS